MNKITFLVQLIFTDPRTHTHRHTDMKILKVYLEEKNLSGYKRRFKSLVKLEKLSQGLEYYIGFGSTK